MKAKRGDCVAVVETRTDYYIGQENQTRTTVTLGRVTSVTREGAVKAAERFNGGLLIGTYHPVTSYRVLVIPASMVHPSDVARQAELHRWPGGQPYMPFDSVREVRETLRPFLVETAQSA